MTLEELEMICEAATPGPWYERLEDDYYQGGEYLGHGPLRFLRPDEPVFKIPVPQVECSPAEAQNFKNDVCRIESGDHDKTFIRAARTYMPLLIAVAKAAQIAGEDHDLLCEDANQSLEVLNATIEKLQRQMTGETLVELTRLAEEYDL